MPRPSKKSNPHSGAKGSGVSLPEAKVFMTGRSQAVRLPKEFRVAGDSVYVKRLGDDILLMPKSRNRWGGLFAALDEFPRDFTLDRDQRQSPRPGLEDLFGADGE
jgi:antitoxin VapB